MRGWRNRQTRWIQVPVPERAWGFNSPLAHREEPPLRRNPERGFFRCARVSAGGRRVAGACVRTRGRERGGVLVVCRRGRATASLRACVLVSLRFCGCGCPLVRVFAWLGSCGLGGAWAGPACAWRSPSGGIRGPAGPAVAYGEAVRGGGRGAWCGGGGVWANARCRHPPRCAPGTRPGLTPRGVRPGGARGLRSVRPGPWPWWWRPRGPWRARRRTARRGPPWPAWCGRGSARER